MRESNINLMWVWFGHSHNYWKLFCIIKANQRTNQTEIWNDISKQLGEHY